MAIFRSGTTSVSTTTRLSGSGFGVRSSEFQVLGSARALRCCSWPALARQNQNQNRNRNENAEPRTPNPEPRRSSPIPLAQHDVERADEGDDVGDEMALDQGAQRLQ